MRGWTVFGLQYMYVMCKINAFRVLCNFLCFLLIDKYIFISYLHKTFFFQ